VKNKLVVVGRSALRPYKVHINDRTMQNTFSRRSLLKAGTVAASLAGLKHFFGIPLAFAQDSADDDLQTIINLAATAELFATTHYLAAINGDLGLAEAQVNYLKTGFLAEQDHLDLLVSLGATPLFTEFYVPETLFSDVALFSTITEVAETTFVGAYLAATRIFTVMGLPAFAVTTAQIAGVEAEHRALVRQIGGRVANNIPYAQFTLNNVSDAVPILLPFLDGSGEGFIGPVAPPTAEQIAAVRAEMAALGYDNSVLPYAAIAAASSSSASTCMVTAGSQNVNIRESASTSAAVIGTIASGQSAAVDGQATGDDGATWWHISSGGYVRSDTVSAEEACSALPSM
jgi:Bacterial SH3 domain/Ferritin-like domain